MANWEMEGQMNIYDFLKTPCLDDMTEEEMIQIVSDRTGIEFVYVDDFWKWQCKNEKNKYSIGFSNYKMKDNTNRFISCGWEKKNEGCHSPCDSIDEAVNFFNRMILRS